MTTQASPWLTNKNWVDNRIKSGARSGLIVTWVFAVIWNALTAPMILTSYTELLEDAKNDPITYVAFIFPLIGLFLIFWAIKLTIEKRTFGNTPLVLDPFPGSIGGHIGGSIETNINYSSQSEGQICVQCLYSYISGSGKNRSRSESIKWQNIGICHLDQSAKGTIFKFRFDIPEDLPESESGKRGSSYYLWRVILEARNGRSKLSRTFEVPVYKTATPSSSIWHGTEDHQATLAAAEAGIAAVAEIRTAASGIEVWYRPFQRPLQGISMMIFGGLFICIGLVVGHAGAPLIFPIGFPIVGGIIVLAGLHYLGKSLRVSINQEGIKARRFLFGYAVATKQIAADQFSGFEIKQNGTMQVGTKTTVYYNLLAISKDGQKFTVAERHISRPEIELMQEKFEASIR